MKNLDRISFFILFLFGLGMCLKSLTYQVGSLRTPGAGLFPLIASILLMATSVIFIGGSFLKRTELENGKITLFPEKEVPKRILLAFMFLIGFRYVFPHLGFAPSAFCFIFCLARFLSHLGWGASLFFAGSAASGAYFLFQFLLKIQVPRGIFGI